MQFLKLHFLVHIDSLRKPFEKRVGYWDILYTVHYIPKYIYIYIYVSRVVGCFSGSYKANRFNRNTHNADHYSLQLFGGE